MRRLRLRPLTARSAPVTTTVPSPSRTAWPSPVRLYLASFLVVGGSLSVLGPALTELRERSGSGIGAIGVLFMGQSIGYIVGSVLAGRLYDRHDGHRVFALALLVLAAGLVIVPVFDSRMGLFLSFVVIGFGGSATDLGANTLLMWQLGSGGGRAMNLLHMFFGIGAVIAPLLVYLGFGVATRSGAALCVVLAALAMRIPSPTRPPAAREEHTDTTRPMLALLGLFFTLYVGTEIGFAGWIKTYGEEIEFTELAATWLVTVFWIGFTLGRAAAAAISHRVAPVAMLWVSCSATVVLAVLLLIADGATSIVWVGTAVMGAVLGPQFAAMMNAAEQRIHVSGTATAWFVGGAGLGGLAFPWMIGRWLDSSGATALPWAMIAFGTATLVSFVVAVRALGHHRAT
jgi:MFS transporter, FHS family, Na+ dependent glucose transporter 1